MIEDSIAYLRIKGIGSYALSKPIHRPPLPPKNFLIRLTPESEKKHEKELRDAIARCVKTRTGARFCVINFDNVTLDAMEMCMPVYQFEHIVKHREEPTIEECREKKKNWFLVVKCEPKEFCGVE